MSDFAGQYLEAMLPQLELIGVDATLVYSPQQRSRRLVPDVALDPQFATPHGNPNRPLPKTDAEDISPQNNAQNTASGQENANDARTEMPVALTSTSASYDDANEGREHSDIVSTGSQSAEPSNTPLPQPTPAFNAASILRRVFAPMMPARPAAPFPPVAQHLQLRSQPLPEMRSYPSNATPHSVSRRHQALPIAAPSPPNSAETVATHTESWPTFASRHGLNDGAGVTGDIDARFRLVAQPRTGSSRHAHIGGKRKRDEAGDEDGKRAARKA